MNADHQYKWVVQLKTQLSAKYGMYDRQRTIAPGKYEMHSSTRKYRLSARGRGFFDLSQSEIEQLIKDGKLSVIDGDWPPQ